MRTPARLHKPFLDATTKDDIYGHSVTQGDKQTIDDALALVDIHRSLNCPHYRDCLNFAVKQHWFGWSCQKCEHHDPDL